MGIKWGRPLHVSHLRKTEIDNATTNVIGIPYCEISTATNIDGSCVTETGNSCILGPETKASYVENNVTSGDTSFGISPDNGTPEPIKEIPEVWLTLDGRVFKYKPSVEDLNKGISIINGLEVLTFFVDPYGIHRSQYKFEVHNFPCIVDHQRAEFTGICYHFYKTWIKGEGTTRFSIVPYHGTLKMMTEPNSSVNDYVDGIFTRHGLSDALKDDLMLNSVESFRRRGVKYEKHIGFIKPTKFIDFWNDPLPYVSGPVILCEDYVPV